MALSGFRADLRLAIRQLSRSRGFSVAVVLVMGLGIGANTAIFAALDQTVIRPLPYRDPGNLVMIWEDFAALGGGKTRVSPATFLDWRRRARTFADLAAYGAMTKTVSGRGLPEEVFGQRVTANLIPMLGVPPLLGRTFTPEEEARGVKVVVISHRLWQRRFAGDRDIAGKTMLMNDEP